MIRLFRVSMPTSIVVLLLSEVVLLTFCYVLTSFWILEADPKVYLLYDGGLARILVVVGVIVFVLHFLDLYSVAPTAMKTTLVLEITQTIGFALIVEALLAYGSPSWRLPGHIMLWGSALALVALSAWRIMFGMLFMPAFARERVLFLGINPVVEEITERLEQSPQFGYTNAGYVDDSRTRGETIHGAAVLGSMQKLREIAAEVRPDRIVVGMSERRGYMPTQELLDLRLAGVVIEEAGAMYEVVCGRVSTKELRPAQLIFSGELGPRRSSVLLQSAYSSAMAVATAVASLPVLLLTAAAVKLSSRGPVLFRQPRVGQNGKVFTLYKFRSMHDDAEADTGAVWASKEDPRVTRVGRWLRRLRFDELPQLWNVLRGDMTLVGPRPERPEFVKVLAEKIPFYNQRHCVKPGITGWAQINHKYGDSIQDTVTKLEYDLYYIKRISPSLDAYILFQTLKTILKQRGAQ